VNQNPPNEDQKLLLEYDERGRTKPWTVYPFTCVPAILPFHESTSDIRVLAGPNRGGKTTAGAFELVSYATGYNPIRDETYPLPNVCWGVAIDYQSTPGRVMLERIRNMLPRKRSGGPTWRYFKQEHIFRLGAPYHSEIHLKSQEEGREHFYGGDPYAIWIDEGKEGEVGQENFNEMLIRRTPGRPLKIFLTLTPLNGYDWLWKRLWNADPKNRDFIPGTFRHRFSIYDCLREKGGFWTQEEIDSWPQYSEDEKAARLEGDFTPFGSSPFFPVGLLIRKHKIAPEGTQEEKGTKLREKVPGHSYLAVWDPSMGTGGDSSCFSVWDRHDLAEAFYAKRNDLDPELFYRDIVYPVGMHYDAKLAIEVNGEGGGAAMGVARDHYPDLYMQMKVDKALAVQTENLGWRTTSSPDGTGGSRGRMLEALMRSLREDRWTPSRDLISEMSHIVKRPRAMGGWKAQARDGFHDDHVMAAGIALAIHYEYPLYDEPNWARHRVEFRDSLFTLQ